MLHQAGHGAADQSAQVQGGEGSQRPVADKVGHVGGIQNSKIPFLAVFSFLKLEGNRGVDINATSDNLSIRSLNNIDIKAREGQVLIIKLKKK